MAAKLAVVEPKPAPKPAPPTPAPPTPAPGPVIFRPSTSILVPAPPTPIYMPAAPATVTPRPTAPASTPAPTPPPPVVDVDDRGEPVGGHTSAPAPAPSSPTPAAPASPYTPTGVVYGRVDAPQDANPILVVSTPIPLDTGYNGNQTDVFQTPPPLRDVVTQLGGLSVLGGDSKDAAAAADPGNTGIVPPTAIGQGFHLSMAIVLLGVGLVALALWKVEG